MSHWRIDNPCCGHAPFQSFTPRFPWPIDTTCSCHVSMSVESLAISCVPVCSVCLGEFGEPGLPPTEGSRSQLFECKRRTHTRWLCRLCMLYKMTKCVDWQLWRCRTPSERHSGLRTFGPNQTEPAEMKRASAGVQTCKTAQLTTLFCSSHVHLCSLIYSPEMESTTPSVYSSQALNISVN